MIRTYDELIKLPTFEDRFNYLKLNGRVAEETFGFDRWLNQVFYRSPQWKRIRNQVIIRDNGCDLGIVGRDIPDRIYVHHMNPLLLNDIKNQTEYLTNPNFLICTSFMTHEAIHYGDEHLLMKDPVERKPGDTTLW
jgi:hypothetical protein